MNTGKIYLLICMVLISSAVRAEAEVQRSEVDSRTVIFKYREGETYPVDLYPGFATRIYFSGKEMVQVPESGWPEEAWEISTPAPHILSIKPTNSIGTTNFFVTTRLGEGYRNYAFHFKLRGEYDSEDRLIMSQADSPTEHMMWQVNFDYPKPKVRKVKKVEPKPPKRPELPGTKKGERHEVYAYAGTPGLRPYAFHNGKFMFLKFPPLMDAPVLYRVDVHTGKVSLLNDRGEVEIDGQKYTVIEGRYDQIEIRINNDPKTYGCLFDTTRVKPAGRTDASTSVWDDLYQ